MSWETRASGRATAARAINQLRASRARFVSALEAREQGLAPHFGGDRTLRQVIAALQEAAPAQLAVILSEEAEGYVRALAQDDHGRTTSTTVHSPDLVAEAHVGLPFKRTRFLAGAMAEKLSQELGLSPCNLFCFRPISVEDHFSGLLGLGVNQGPDSNRAFPLHVSALVMLRLIEGEVTRFLRHTRSLEQTYRAGARQERIHLGMDLHDTVLQDLSYLRLQAESIRRGLEPGSAVEGRLHKMSDDLGRVGRELRQLAVALTETERTGDLVVDVNEMIERYRGRIQAEIQIRIAGRPRRLGTPIEANLLRMLQEALNNVWKHAEARKVLVSLEYFDDRVMLMVKDDGLGFDINAPRPTGIGLTSMQHRAVELGGAMNITSAPGKGTCVSIEVPT